MIAIGARAGLLVLATAGVWAALQARAWSPVEAGLMHSTLMVTEVQSPAPSSPPDSLVSRAFERPVFRPDRRPGAGRFDPALRAEAGNESGPVPVERPTPALSGIIWGAEPAALIEGMPGAQGSLVMRRGEVASGIRVVRIEPQRVVLVGGDTTWTLKVREPWP
jgi:hypothetical protein